MLGISQHISKKNQQGTQWNYIYKALFLYKIRGALNDNIHGVGHGLPLGHTVEHVIRSIRDGEVCGSTAESQHKKHKGIWV